MVLLVPRFTLTTTLALNAVPFSVTVPVRVKLTVFTVSSPNSLLSAGAVHTVLAVFPEKLPHCVAPVGGVQDQLTLAGVLLSESDASTKAAYPIPGKVEGVAAILKLGFEVLDPPPPPPPLLLLGVAVG